MFELLDIEVYTGDINSTQLPLAPISYKHRNLVISIRITLQPESGTTMAINAIVCSISKNKKNKMFIILSVTHTQRGTWSRITPFIQLLCDSSRDVHSKGHRHYCEGYTGPHLLLHGIVYSTC